MNQRGDQFMKATRGSVFINARAPGAREAMFKGVLPVHRSQIIGDAFDQPFILIDHESTTAEGSGRFAWFASWRPYFLIDESGKFLGSARTLAGAIKAAMRAAVRR